MSSASSTEPGPDRAAYFAAYRVAHREEIAAYKATYRATHAAEAAAYNAAHREERAAYHAEWYVAHRAEQAAHGAAWHINHREEKNAYDATYRVDHRAQIAAYNVTHRAEHAAVVAAWFAAHRDERREYHRKSYAKRLSAPTCEHASCLAIGPTQLAWQTNEHACYLCDTPLWQGVNLHMDHVIPLSRGGIHCADNLRPACAPCNTRKGAKVPA